MIKSYMSRRGISFSSTWFSTLTRSITISASTNVSFKKSESCNFPAICGCACRRTNEIFASRNGLLSRSKAYTCSLPSIRTKYLERNGFSRYLCKLLYLLIIQKMFFTWLHLPSKKPYKARWQETLYSYFPAPLPTKLARKEMKTFIWMGKI